MKSPDLAADQLVELAEQLEMEVEVLSREWAMINERIGLKRRLAADLRREAESRSDGGARLLQLPAHPVASEPNAVHGNGKPGTSEAVQLVLAARSEPATVTEVCEELDRRGWLPTTARNPRSAVKAALWNLGDKGRIERLGDTPATRRWAAQTASLTPTTTGEGKPVA